MPKSDLDATIRASVDAFVDELTEIIRQAALESVREALAAEGAPARRGPGRPRKASSMAAARPARKSGKRIRRSIEDLEKMAKSILAFVKANPGCGIVDISKAMRTPNKDLKRPIQMLIAEKKLRTEGQKRGTTYHAGAARGGKKKTKKRKTRRKAS